MFSGDTLFPGGPGATRWPYSSFGQIMDSIEKRLMAYPDPDGRVSRARSRNDHRPGTTPSRGMACPWLVTDGTSRSRSGAHTAEILTAARWAESFGLAALALPDHYLASATELEEPAWDCLVQFAGIARETERIELIDLVSPITFRHPAVYAKMAVTLSDMSDNRFWLGLGTGWMEEEHRLFGFDFPETTERFLMLEEALGYLDALTHGNRIRGTPTTVSRVLGLPHHFGFRSSSEAPASPRPRLWLATLPVSSISSRARPDDIAGRIEQCLQTATLRGRSPSDIRISFTCIPVGGMDEDGYRKISGTAGRLARSRARSTRRTPRLSRHPPWNPRSGCGPDGQAGRSRRSRIYLQCATTDPAELEELVAPYLP